MDQIDWNIQDVFSQQGFCNGPFKIGVVTKAQLYCGVVWYDDECVCKICGHMDERRWCFMSKLKFWPKTLGVWCGGI